MITQLPATNISVLGIIITAFLLICVVVIINLLLIKLFLAIPPIRHLAQSIMRTLMDWK